MNTQPHGRRVLFAAAVCAGLLATSGAGEPAPGQGGTMSQTDPASALWTLSLDKSLGERSLVVLLASRGGQWVRAICRPGTYNNEAHEVSITASRVADGAFSGALKITLNPDSWTPKSRKVVICELTIEGTTKEGSLAGTYKGKCGEDAASGTLSGTVTPLPAVPASAMLRLSLEKAVTGWAPHMTRGSLDIAWADGAAREAHMRSAYGWGWTSRIEPFVLKLTAETLEGEFRALVGSQPGSTDLGTERYVYSLRGTVVGSCVAGKFQAKREGQEPLRGGFRGHIEAGPVEEGLGVDRMALLTHPQEAIAVDARTAHGGPVVRPWRTFSPDPKFRGGFVVGGDVDGDGQAELVMGMDDAQVITEVLAYKLDGTLLWRWGQERGGRQAEADRPLQVYDIEGKGRADVYLSIRGFLVVLDGQTGKETKRWPLPPGLGAADCITFADFRGLGRARDIIVKSRHGHIWVYTDEWKPLWDWAPPAGYQTCHHPTPVDVDADGKDELVGGFGLLGPDGKERWKLKSSVSDLTKGHVDSSAVLQVGRKPQDTLLVMAYDTANGLCLVDGAGQVRWEIGGSHFQCVQTGKMRADVEGAQIMAAIAYARYGRTWIVDLKGRLLVEFLEAYGGLMDWDGDGLQELISTEGKVFNGKGQCVAELGLEKSDAAVPGNGVIAADLDGDGRPEVLLYTWPGVQPENPRFRIYKSEKTPKVPGIPLGTPNFTLYR